MSRIVAPVPTRYAGCHFRSRLEARWAVGFDAAGLTWQYEPEGFEIGPRWYLPDFYVKEWDTWVEVKGTDDGADWDMWAVAVDNFGDGGLPPTQWARGCGHGGSSLLILSDIPDPRKAWFHPFIVNQKGWMVYAAPPAGLWEPDPYASFGQKEMGSAWETEEGAWVDSPIGVDSRVFGWPGVVSPNPHVARIYTAARSARFEHGESGAS